MKESSTADHVTALFVVFIIALGFFLFGYFATSNPNQTTSTPQVQPATSANIQEVRVLMAQTETLIAQIKNPNILKDQLKAVEYQTCDLISDVKTPPFDIVSYSSQFCFTNGGN